jgi:hypothetical protein
MSVRSWRRLHGADLIAQVDPVPGIGTWIARAWVETDSLRSEISPRRFEMLMSAQAAADHMVRQHFVHRCDFVACGEWLPCAVPEPA